MLFGSDITHGGTSIAFLVGIDLERTGLKHLWTIERHLSASQCVETVRSLEAAAGSTADVAQALEQEKLLGEAQLKNEFRIPSWRLNMATNLLDQMGVPRNDQSGPFKLALQLAIDLSTPQKMLGQNDAYYDDQIRLAVAQYTTKAKPKRLALDPLHTVMFMLYNSDPYTAYEGLKLQYDLCCVQSSLLCAALALRAYHADNRAYAPSLAVLVPRYIDRVSDDPFALTGPLRYRRAGSSYLLYSVGPDAQDDGGRAISGSVGKDSEGDIVAGVNL